MRMTRIGGPTVLVELEGWRILVDPTFDPPGKRYAFALGTSSVKTRGPAVAAADLGLFDLVLVSHDHHADNLDPAGRALLPDARHVVTTASGARRLALPNVHGLRAGESVELETDGRPRLQVTATPCRHGPPLSQPIVGDVVGFAIRLPGRDEAALWVTGDTVLTKQVRQAARELDVDVAIVNAGGVRFGATGPLRYTMTGSEAVRLVAELEPRVAVPAHYDGWSHFRDGEDGMRSAVADAPPAVRERFRWLPDGVPVEV
ncbi:MBL fold metallo-hydrolase [Microbacterium sp. BWT-B31]|uniref:MBL fold metallo-hydrolase n=1 Tax=Microbacterium sp. BWT-B31 TaxID=3232072 RepID=UPI0035292E0D